MLKSKFVQLSVRMNAHMLMNCAQTRPIICARQSFFFRAATLSR